MRGKPLDINTLITKIQGIDHKMMNLRKPKPASKASA